MTVYVDSPTRYPGQGNKRWFHLWADDIDELQAFARLIELDPDWFQDRPGFPHYDVLLRFRGKAISAGAKERSVANWLRTKRARNGVSSI